MGSYSSNRKITKTTVDAADNKVAAQDQGNAFGRQSSNNSVFDTKDSINSNSNIAGGNITTSLGNNTLDLLKTQLNTTASVLSNQQEFINSQSSQFDTLSSRFLTAAQGIPLAKGLSIGSQTLIPVAVAVALVAAWRFSR